MNCIPVFKVTEKARLINGSKYHNFINYNLESGYEDEYFYDIKYKILEMRDEMFRQIDDNLDLDKYLDSILEVINEYSIKESPKY